MVKRPSGGVRPHVELLDAEVNRVGPRVERGGERFSRTHGRHDFKIGGRKSFNGGANIVCVHNYHI